MNYESDSNSYVEGLSTRDFLFYKQKEQEIETLRVIARELSTFNRFYRNINRMHREDSYDEE